MPAPLSDRFGGQDAGVEDLDFAGRRCPVKAKGARTKARRRGQAREDFVLETVYWDDGTARLLKGRTRGPVFVTHRRPGPGKVVSSRDVCPGTGLARLRRWRSAGLNGGSWGEGVSALAAGEHCQGSGTLCDEVVVGAVALSPAVHENLLDQDLVRGGVL